MEEIWKPVVGFENRYQISTYGNLKSNDYLIHYKNGKTEFRKGRIRKANIINGYRCFLLVKKTGCKRVSMRASRMVAMAFIPNPENKPCVDHIDTNTFNDSVENLRWATHSENNRNPITMTKYRKPGDYSHSEETKIKIGLASLGRRMKPETIEKLRSYSKKVVMFSKEGHYIRTFPGVHFAKQETGAQQSHISSCCKGSRKSAGGYMWRYEDEWDGKPLPPFFIEKPVCRRKPNFSPLWYDKMRTNKEKYKKKVLVYDMDGNFICECSSVTDAAFKFKTDSSRVSRACNGKIRHSNNFIFKFKTNE